jgi:hypothetical protein
MKKWWFQLGVIALCALGGAVHALQGTSPLLVVVNGRLYRLEGAALVAYDACQPDEYIVDVPVVHPDHTQFLLRTEPAFVTEAYAQQSAFPAAEPPANVWLCSPATATLTLLAGQPEGVSTDVADAEGIRRSQPVWGYYGRQAAWTERAADDSLRLVIHNLRQGQSQHPLVEPGLPLELSPDFLEAPPISASRSGFHVALYTAPGGQPQEAVYTYDINGVLIAAQRITPYFADDAYTIEAYTLANRGVPVIAVNSSAGWYLLLPLTGDSEGANPTVVRGIHERGACPNGIALTVEDGVNVWRSPNGAYGPGLELRGWDLRQIAQSPDDGRIAFIDDALYVWDAGELNAIDNTYLGAGDVAYVAWGATQFDLSSDNPIAC